MNFKRSSRKFLKKNLPRIIIVSKQSRKKNRKNIKNSYLLSDTVQSFPGLCLPFLWETGSLESSVTKQTSKRRLSESLNWLIGKMTYRKTHVIPPVTGSHSLTTTDGMGRMSSVPTPIHPNTEASVTFLMITPLCNTLGTQWAPNK